MPAKLFSASDVIRYKSFLVTWQSMCSAFCHMENTIRMFSKGNPSNSYMTEMPH